VEIGLAPVRVSEDMKSSVYDPLHTVVLTSATLTVGGGFEFIGDRLGLGLIEPERFRSGTHPSPFDYRRQVLTVVPTDLPAPDSREFPAALPGAVLKILEATGGRAFVLFTSFHLLRHTHAALAGPLIARGMRPIAQGDAPRSEILDRFRTGVANVLFGTDSFWEGVDVKGRALECVIITRLPFRVPSEPIQEARLEDIERRGGNAFVEFTVPQAVLKFKQGFGRLIRSKTDRGVVAVLDRRILSKPYGRVFLRSLPETDLRKAPLEEILADLRSFFPAHDAAAPASRAPVSETEET
jgi:ATP-dependent DNA helicase DinG